MQEFNVYCVLPSVTEKYIYLTFRILKQGSEEAEKET